MFSTYTRLFVSFIAITSKHILLTFFLCSLFIASEVPNTNLRYSVGFSSHLPMLYNTPNQIQVLSSLIRHLWYYYLYLV